jgi:hypothetical protein
VIATFCRTAGTWWSTVRVDSTIGAVDVLDDQHGGPWTVELEDAGGTSWWTGLLATLAGQYGNAYLRFVGRVAGERRYTSPTFPVPRTLGTLPPQEEWAPEMRESLEELYRDLDRDGWVQVGRGEQPWSLRYERQEWPARAAWSK